MKFGTVTPILRIFDELKAKEFYIDFLGFKIDWEHRFEEGTPLYLQISKGDCLIHLSEHFGDASPGGAVRILTDELEVFQKLLIDKQYKHARPGIVKQAWNCEEMMITDPFHNRLIFLKGLGNRYL